MPGMRERLPNMNEASLAKNIRQERWSWCRLRLLASRFPPKRALGFELRPSTYLHLCVIDDRRPLDRQGEDRTDGRAHVWVFQGKGREGKGAHFPNRESVNRTLMRVISRADQDRIVFEGYRETACEGEFVEREDRYEIGRRRRTGGDWRQGRGLSGLV